MRSVLITGAGGNLGRKLTAHLLETPWCEEVVALDRAQAPAGSERADPRVRRIEADLKDPNDARWRDALSGVDAVVHLAAQNPDPDAPWSDAAASYDMTLHVVGAAAASGVRRLVFASSNHVMGRYKDPPLADGLAPGTLGPASPPAPGTRWFNGREMVEGVAYGSSKLMGERLCIATAALSGGALTTVSVRIGWCQPGDNDPRTINSSGVAGAEAAEDPDAERNLRWFRNMWLSNLDYGAVMERALVADPAGWPAPGIVVNGMSANAGMAWDLDTGRRLIGYAPQDDVWRRLAEEERPSRPRSAMS
jgi:nucleoside-diphosphate-sugar epimerase